MSKYTGYKEKGASPVGIIAGIAVVVVVALAAIYLVDVDQTQEARLPDVDVSVSGGQMPTFDADVAEIKVGTKPMEVEVPDVDVKTKTVEVEVPVGADFHTEKETISVPDIAVIPPRADDPANQ